MGPPKGGGPKGGGPNPEKVGPRKVGAPKGGAQKGGAQKGGGPKISRFFFPSSATIFHLLSLSWGPFVEFWWCLKRRGPEMCTFGVLGLSCASPGGPVWWGRRGFTRQPESPNVHISGFRPSKTPTKFNERTPKREKKERKLWRERDKKERNFGRSGGGLSGGGGSPEGSSPEGNGVQGSGFRVQFRFLGTKTEPEQKQNEERDE